MLYFTFKEPNGFEDDVSWHNGDKLPKLEFDNYKRELISIQADGDELNFIYLLVSGIPVPKIPLSVVTWHQPWAQFIYDCMVGVEVSNQIYDKRIHKIVKKGK